MAQAVEEWYKQMPIITRSYLTAAIVTTIGCSLDIISPYNLYLNPTLVVKQYQLWRLVTNFLYFRKMVSDIINSAVIIYTMISFSLRTSCISFTRCDNVPVFNSLTFMMVYVWSKQNPFIHMSFLGLFTFTAAYLPWVLLGFSVLVGASAWVDLLGMIAGHAYYFLEEVYPRMTNRRPLKTPSFIKALFADEPVVVARPANVRFAPPAADDVLQG
uniref:Derlin n=1 Tax=Fagus sylvatica TaxID=28930 RepID=A0A2N9ISD6_FAGSY